MSIYSHQPMINHHGSGFWAQVEETIHVWRERMRQRRELAQWTDRDLHDVGVSRSDIVHEAERPVENLNNLPKPAYHLADFDGYARARGKREMGYATSLGCPYACNYCTDQVFYKRRFNAYKGERVVSEVTELVERRDDRCSPEQPASSCWAVWSRSWWVRYCLRRIIGLLFGTKMYA